MRKVIFVVMMVAVLSGCSLIQQAREDYTTGKVTPLSSGEVSPKDEANKVKDLIAMLPFGEKAAPIAGGILTVWYTLVRGRRLRKGLPYSPMPATGFLGKFSGLEAVVQETSNMIRGAFEVGADNSAWKRAWKVGLASVLGLASIASTNADFQTYLLAHPDVGASIAGLAALFGGIEKQLSKVLPVNEETK